MWNFDTNDSQAVAHQVDILLFNIQTDPEGAFEPNLVHEPAAPSLEQVPPAAMELPELTIHTPAGPCLLRVADIPTCTSRSQLRIVMVGILMTRQSATGDDRDTLLGYLNLCMNRLNQLCEVEGA